MLTLKPMWRPVPLGTTPPPAAAAWFPPVVVEAAGVVVTGTAAELFVVQVDQTQRLFFSIPATVKISGFAVNGSNVYVQDGPTLTMWDLTAGQATSTSIVPGSGALTYSAPVVRRHQLYGELGGQVFSLASDGSLYAMDAALTHKEEVNFGAPSPLSLGMLELPTPGDPTVYSCVLSWGLANGSVVQVNAGVNPPQLTGTVLAQSLPVADTAIAASLQAAVLAARNPGQYYELDPSNSLLLSTDGSNSRITCYAPGTRGTDRWGPHTSPKPAWLISLQGTQAWDDDPARLVLEMDRDGATFRVYVAITVDNGILDLMANAPIVLDPLPNTQVAQGTLEFGGAPMSKPVVYENQMFVVAGNALLACSLGELKSEAMPPAVNILQTYAAAVNRVALWFGSEINPEMPITSFAHAKHYLVFAPIPAGPIVPIPFVTDANGFARADAANVGKTISFAGATADTSVYTAFFLTPYNLTAATLTRILFTT